MPLVLVLILLLAGCGVDRYVCKKTQSREPECSQYRIGARPKAPRDSASTLYWVTNPEIAKRASLFPKILPNASAMGGSWLGLPVLVSSGVPTTMGEFCVY